MGPVLKNKMVELRVPLTYGTNKVELRSKFKEN